MNILITGLGALGTVFAAFLKKAGHTVYALTKEKYLDALKGRAVKVSGIWGEHKAVLDGVYSNIEPLSDRNLEIIILTVKAYDTEQAIRQVRPLVGKDTLVLICQNGYGNYETVSREVGKEHTLLSRVIFGVKLLTAGHAEVTVIADDVKIGQPDHAVPAERIMKLASMINKAGIPASYAENVYALLWDKIMYNSALNPLGVILECAYGHLAEHEGTREIMNAVIREIFLTAQAHGISLNWKTSEEYIHHFYTKLVPPTAKHFPSMYYDLKAGKRLEIDALNGAIVKLAREKHVQAPVNEIITYLVRTKEALTALSL